MYGISRQRALSVMRRPERVEEGVVVGATAVMQPVSVKVVAGKRQWRTEVWVMYLQPKKKHTRRILSVWRYPGVSPIHNPIPQDILDEIQTDY
jgi:hypothetical protein